MLPPIIRQCAARLFQTLHGTFKAGDTPALRRRADGLARLALWLMTGASAAWPMAAQGVVLWSDLGATLAHETGAGSDILGGAVKRDDTASDTLYFKFHVDPLSDVGTEEYFAAFQLYEGTSERLAVGNSLKAWAYSAFNTAQTGPVQQRLRRLRPAAPRGPNPPAPGSFCPTNCPAAAMTARSCSRCNMFAGGDDQVTVWLNPDLAPGATEAEPAGKPDDDVHRQRFVQRNPPAPRRRRVRLDLQRHGGRDLLQRLRLRQRGRTGRGDARGGGRGWLTFRSWQREQGLPQNSVRALAQTRDGYLWIGSEDGVARFDGVRFVSFGLREACAAGRCACCSRTQSRHTVAGNRGRRLDPLAGWAVHVIHHARRPAGGLDHGAGGRQGKAAVGGHRSRAGGLAGRAPGAAEGRGDSSKASPLPALFKDRHGVMWLGATGAGIFRFLEGKFVALADGSVEGLLLDPHCLLADKAGRIWVGAGDDFVLCRDGNQWRRYRIPRHLARPYVSALAEEPDGTVWAGSVSEGLFQFKEGKLAAINASSGLLDNSVESPAGGPGGESVGGHRRRVESAAAQHPVGVWAKRRAGLRAGAGVGGNCARGDLGREAERRPVSLGRQKLQPADGRRFVPAVSRGHRAAHGAGRQLLGSGGACGLWRFKDPKTAAGEVEMAALAGLNVLSLAEDRDGGVWAGTREGQVWRQAQGNWVAATNYSQTHAITAIAARYGRGHVDRHGRRRAVPVQGRPARALWRRVRGLLSDWIRTLYLDAQGALWIGTAGGGLSRWRDGQIATFTTREGLPDNTISQILEDSTGPALAGEQPGHCLREQAGVGGIGRGQDCRGLSASLWPGGGDAVGGMHRRVLSGGPQDQSGRLCFSTLKGIVVADPRAQTADAPAPAVVLEETLIDGVVADMKRSQPRRRAERPDCRVQRVGRG